jgi:hypothetical protein
LFEDTDFFGGDLRTLKQIDLAACQRACLEDDACRAFTYNTSARWCFLKSAEVEPKTFQGAVSGLVVPASGAGSANAFGGEDIGEAPPLAYIPRYMTQEARKLARETKRVLRDTPPARNGRCRSGSDGPRLLQLR